MKKDSENAAEKRPTLAMVARVAGVSQATVTRVMHSPALVSEKLVNHVESAIREVGYSAPSGKKLGRPRKTVNGHGSQIFGLVLSGFGGAPISRFPVFPAVLHGIERECDVEQRSLFVGSVSEDGKLPRFFQDQKIDGVLLLGWHKGSEPFCRNLADFPCVSIMTQTYPIGDHVLPDNHRIGELAADCLIEKECEAFSVFNVRPNHLAFQERVRAFEFRVSAHGKRVNLFVAKSVEAINEGPRGVNSLATAQSRRLFTEMVRQFLEGQDLSKKQGLFVPSDLQLIWLYNAFREAGIDISKFRIISADNESPFSGGLDPDPISIDIRAEEIGRRAVRQLVRRISGLDDNSRQRILVEPRLIPSGNEWVESSAFNKSNSALYL